MALTPKPRYSMPHIVPSILVLCSLASWSGGMGKMATGQMSTVCWAPVASAASWPLPRSRNHLRCIAFSLGAGCEIRKKATQICHAKRVLSNRITRFLPTSYEHSTTISFALPWQRPLHPPAVAGVVLASPHPVLVLPAQRAALLGGDFLPRVGRDGVPGHFPLVVAPTLFGLCHHSLPPRGAVRRSRWACR